MLIRRVSLTTVLLVLALVIVPLMAHAQTTEKKGAKPVAINDPIPQPVKDFALEDANPSDPSASPNPRIDMVILDGTGAEVVNAIPLIEDGQTDFFASSEIFGANPPSTMDGVAFANARWLKQATVMWTIDEVRRGKSSLGKSTSAQFRSGFKDPGEYLLSCFAFRDFAFDNKGQEARLTAISSKGIACFVADATPPSFELKFTEYKTAKRSTMTWMEIPPDMPVGSKTWEIFYDGVHFGKEVEERKTGRLRGDLDRQTKVDLVPQKNVPRLTVKKGMTYLLNVEAKDNFQVGKKEWMLMNAQKRNVLEGLNVQKFQLAEDASFVGEHILVVYLQDRGGNDVEVRIPVRIIPK